MPTLPLDEFAAARAKLIFNMWRLPDVPGKPTLREAAGDWFREIVGAVFGSIDDTGLRHVRDVLVMVPKKNGKTTNSAALMLTAMLLDDAEYQFFGLYGPTQAIADLSFDQASGMIQSDPEMSQRFKIVEHSKIIRDLTNKNELKVQTFDASIATGSIPKGILLDEIHVLGKLSYAERVMSQLSGGLTAQEKGFLFKITTQSDEPPTGIFKADLKLGREVRDGKVNVGMLPILYEFPEEMQRDETKPWESSKTWHLVHPNLGRSTNLQLLEGDWEKERLKGPAAERIWLSQHLNIQIGVGLTGDPWSAAQYWEKRGDRKLTLDALLERSEVVVAGIDGGGLDDLLGLALIGRDRETKDWLHWGHAFAHNIVWERRPVIGSKLDDLEMQGEVTRCALGTEDLRGVGDILERVNLLGLFPEDNAVGFDPALAGALVDEAARRGITEKQMIGVPQGWPLTKAIWGLERKLNDGTFWHGAQDLMAWAVGNSRIERRGKNDSVSKEVSGRSKIDPVIAMLNAFTLMSDNPVAGTGKQSIYETRGIRVVG
jgi:phage terminase large subunit-like protein